MTTLTFDVLWRDRGASKGMTDLGTKTDQTTNKFRTFNKVAAAAGVLVGAALVKFARSSVAAYSEAQVAQTKLQDAFRRFPRLADTNIASLRSLNTALAQKTRFDDDATASGQAVLAQFKLTGQQITQLTPLLQDYAAKTGRDLPAAATVLGKAMLGNGRALKEVGINFKDTGTAGGNFEQIMTGLRTQVGGFAQVEGRTAAGQIAILKNRFGELQEAAGGTLVPALTKVVQVLTQLVGFVDRNKAVIGPLAVTVLGLGTALWTVNKATQAFAATSALSAGGIQLLGRAFTALGFSAQTAGRAMRIAQLSIPVVGVALFAVTTAMTAFARKSDVATSSSEDFAAAMETVTGKVTRNTAALNANVRAVAVKSLQDAGAFEQARKLGLGLDVVTDAALGNKNAIMQVNQALARNLALNPQLSRTNSDLRNTASALSKTMGNVSQSTQEAVRKENDRRQAMRQGQAATESAARSVRGYDRDINNLNSKRIDLTARFRATATAAAVNFFKTVPGSQASGFSQLPRGGPAKARSLDSMIGPPAPPPHIGHASGGPSMPVVTQPGLERARRMGQAWDDVAAAAYSAVAGTGLRAVGADGQRALAALGLTSSPGPGGSVGTYSAGMAATIARLRAAGARSFTTYPGHHPSMNKARDVTPHNWRIANTARASSGVWYVIYQMRIASKNHGNTWRQYRPSNFNGDWQHRRHVHVAWYDKGGLLPHGGVAVNGTGRPERVLTPAQTQAYDKGGGNTYVINAPNYVGDKADLVKALTDLDRQGRLAVVKR